MDEVTFLFTDIEGSTRLWEEEPERMRPALARHDAIAREAVAAHRGQLVKSTGDGIHAAFADATDALAAALWLQGVLADPGATEGLALRVRCGLHCGRDERRDGDFFGTAVNRAARIMAAAHGGQVLLSEAVAERARDALPPQASLQDLGRARLRDLTRPERLFQLVHPALRAEFPPLRSLERVPNNLPLTLTSFVGRERELAALIEMLARNRLVTVFGMGGMGKSRIALEAGAETIERFADGVWLVELAATSDAEHVGAAVAAVLRVKEQPGVPVAQTLAGHIRDRRLLLLLDNCEHLVAGCAALARELLESCPGVRILATSREPLQIGGEAVFPLAPLAVPGPRVAFEPDALLRYDSVRLFAERAAIATPSFALDAQNAAAVVAVCHRLDGIPLALELAAARLRSLPVQALAARLKDRLRLLANADPTASPRQRTLRALIDWSHDLLEPSEQVLFRRLAVFAGGFDVEAVEAIAGEGLGDDALLRLGQLVEKSLVLMEGERYGLLETVREYASERLRAAGEESGLHAAHARHFVELAEAAYRQMQGPEQADAFARVGVEHDNILAAHARCDAVEGGAELGLRLVRAMKLFWTNQGRFALAHGATLAALARVPEGGRASETYGLTLFNAGQLSCFMGRYAEARRYLEPGLDILRKAGSTRGVAAVLQPLGMACAAEGDMAAGRACLEESVAIARTTGREHAIAAALNALGQHERLAGAAGAEALYLEAIEIGRRIGDREVVAIGLLNRAMLAIDRADACAARALLVEVAGIVSESGSRPTGQSLLEVCAALAALEDEWLLAARLLGAAEACAAESGLHRDPADEAFIAPWQSRVRAALPAGAAEEILAAGRSLRFDESLAVAQDLVRERFATAR